MALTAFEEFLETPLALPIGGKTYTVQPVGSVAGIRLSALFDQGATGASDEGVEEATELDMYRLALGTAYDALVDDDVPVLALKRAGKTALIAFLRGPDAAERYWNGEVDQQGEAKPAKKAGRSTSTSTGAASTTPSRASMSGTSSRRKPTKS